MKAKLSAIALLAVLVGINPAFATPLLGPTQGQNQDQGQAQGQASFNRNDNDSHNTSNRNSESEGKSEIKSKSKSKAEAGAVAGAVAGNGDQTMIYNEAETPAYTYRKIDNGDYTIKNTPDVTLGNVYPTAPCMGGTSAGGSGPGFSVAFGSSWEATDCQILETARSFEQAGQKADAMAVRCQGKYASVAPSCQKIAAKQQVALAPDPVASAKTASAAPTSSNAAICSNAKAQGDTILASRVCF